MKKFLDGIKRYFRKPQKPVQELEEEPLFRTWWDKHGRHDGTKYTMNELQEGIKMFETDNPPGRYTITDLYYKYGIAHFLLGEDVGDFNNFCLYFYKDYDMTLWIMAHIMVDRGIELDPEDFTYIKKMIENSPYQSRHPYTEGNVDITKLIIKKE